MSTRNSLVHGDALAQQWLSIGDRARTRHLRRMVVRAALGALMLLGTLQLGAILAWAARTTSWWALIPVGAHVLAIVLALGLPASVVLRLTMPVRRFRGALLDRLTDRVARLRALRNAIGIEVVALFAWPPLEYLATGAPPRWGVTFTTAVCSLAILWPLQRIAQAQRAESRRLLDVAGGDAP